ncbi:MAG: TetR/AcrR family transcriptional regulator [Solirubrobacteraceae bacterium]
MASSDPTLAPSLTRALASRGHHAPAGQELIGERILDAALELVSAYGPRRSSMDEIARRAGVARATVFRRFGSKEGVIDSLFAREVSRILVTLRDTIAAAPDPASSVVDAFVAVVRYCTSHPLLVRLGRVEPQVLIGSLRSGDPSAFELGRAFVAERLRSGQRRGAIPAGDADGLADTLVRLTLSYLLIPGQVVDLHDEQQVRALARATLAPLVTRPAP